MVVDHMQKTPKMHTGLGLSFLAAATAAFVPLASCASTGISDVYMSPDLDGARTQSVFYAGEPVNCVLKMNSGRKDETLLVSFKPLEANGDVLDLPSILVSNTAPGKTNGAIGTPFPPPAVIAFANPAVAAKPDLLVVHPDIANGDPNALNNQIDLLKEIRAKMYAHFTDGIVHKMPDLSAGTPGPDAESTPAAVFEVEEVTKLFIGHIGSTMYHDFADTRNVPTAPSPDVMSFGSTDLKLAAAFVQSFSTKLNELKQKLNAHMSTIVQNPAQTAGRYRCEVQLADEKKSVDFVILPGGIPQPPPTSNIPRVGMCDGDPVANCLDPMKGPNILRCCTKDNACGSGPKGTPFCY